MSKEDDNKAIVGRWFTDFWGKTCNLDIVDELAAPDMLLHYLLHEPRRGRDDIKAFMTDFREAFPDLNFWGAADLIAEGAYVVGPWEGEAHIPVRHSAIPHWIVAARDRTEKMRFTGTAVLRLNSGKIVEENRAGRRRDGAATTLAPQGSVIEGTALPQFFSNAERI
jgi:SnoaL-like polyketide cyclase